MRKSRLDRIDRKILHDLQEDGRMTNVELAEHAGISAPPCLRRVRALEEAGIIRGYHADINPSALGFGVVVFAHIGLERQTEQDLKAFEERVQTWKQVRECHLVSGESDFILKIVSEDWESYQQFLTGELTTTKNISHVKSSLRIRASKKLPNVPIDRE